MDKITRKTVFMEWATPISNELFAEQVQIHCLDHNTKKLHMTSFMDLLLYAQLHETESLRAVSDSVFSEELQEARNLDSISFSQLSRRLRQVPTEFFQAIFHDLVSQIHCATDFQTRRNRTTPLKIIDSSTLPLNLNHHRWAEFRKTKSGIKLHLRLVFMKNGCSYPDQAVLTNAKEHDRGQLEILVDDKECLYVFDRGYLDYERFDLMTDEGYFFVSRLRKNAVVRSLEYFELPEDTLVLSDEMVVMGTTQNRFDLSADEITDLYKSRWAIELFFKWMKQHLNIKKFYAQNQQGVHNQVYLAMIVYCLNVLAQLQTKSERIYLQFSGYLKVSLWKSAHIWLRKIEGKSVP
ncbi:IS4 family transposase [Sporosarcina sp. PTS2304]|uniref:IS4 family transposase n=1 Tax=Sporosarcina sp. PTS2304 TaxID=2283194 RepID=UPI000E0D621B|nr:IS4 family transposase [Sporosarcina sp. PTS2304]AXI00769.1 IS4 family transposase [Sporosarcina sp. PTS2304]